MTCEQAVKELSLLLYDELTFEQEEALHQHLEGCESCRRALARERALHEAVDRAEVAPAADLVAKCRRELRERLAAVSRRPNRVQEFWSAMARPLAMPWVKPVGALALIAAGFFGARLTQDSTGRFTTEPAPAEPVATHVRYLQPDPSGRVRIVLDETHQRVLTGRLEDSAIRQLLLSAARESSDPGLRVVSMDMLRSGTQSTEVRAALLQAIQTDPIPGVRLKALEGLKPFAPDAETRDVLARVLLTDDNPGVRIQAIDLLTQNQQVEIAGVLQELLAKESNNYVRLRCQKALREMNASMETF